VRSGSIDERARQGDVALVLDAGGLIAIDRGDRFVGPMLRLAFAGDIPVVTSAAVVAQVWRRGARQAVLARTLRGVRVQALDAIAGRRVGELLASTGTADVVDAHLASLVNVGDTVLTSDEPDIRQLLATRALVEVRLVVV
jgi:hypothetical protein